MSNWSHSRIKHFFLHSASCIHITIKDFNPKTHNDCVNPCTQSSISNITQTCTIHWATQKFVNPVLCSLYPAHGHHCRFAVGSEQLQCDLYPLLPKGECCPTVTWREWHTIKVWWELILLNMNRQVWKCTRNTGGQYTHEYAMGIWSSTSEFHFSNISIYKEQYMCL